MGEISGPQKAKLFCGLLLSNTLLLQPALKALSEHFGKIDIQTQPIDFTFTKYYNTEMGEDIKRLWVSFENLILPDELAQIKLTANNIEEAFSSNSRRHVNVDPGYITPANVVLASTKNFSHRIYLSDGIYGEVTLMYQHEDYIKLAWSYPDYSSSHGKTFLLECRKILMPQLKSSTPAQEKL